MKNIPLIQLIATYIVSFVDVSGMFYVYLSNFLGYSVLTSIYILSKHKTLTYIEKITTTALLFISIFNFLSVQLNYIKYEKLFQSIILVSIITAYFYHERRRT